MWWAGRSWACQTDCRPSTSSWQCTVLGDNPVVSPDVPPLVPHATRSGFKGENTRDVKTHESQGISWTQRASGWGHIPSVKTNMQTDGYKHCSRGVTAHVQLISAHLSAWQTEPRLLTVGKHLPQGDTKHPHVWRVGEWADTKTLRGTPGRSGHTAVSDISKLYFLLRVWVFPTALTMQTGSFCVLT